MDNRDSSGSPAAVAGKDGSAMDDGLFLVTSGLAKEAAVLFQSRRYTECIDVLKQVLQKKEDDPKVLHNIAVAEYCHDGCPDPKKLFDGFDRVKKKSEDLASKSGEQMEAASCVGSDDMLGSRGCTTTLHQFSAANAGTIAFIDEFDTSIVTFNTDRFCLIVHNCGLQHLVCGKPLAAARFFRQVIPVFGNRPLFWLRFAECCLLLSEKGLLGGSSSGEEIKVHVAGSGKWQQLVVNNVNSRSTDSDSIAGDAVTSGDDQILISLPFARQCLLNAQLLLDTLDRKMTKLDATDFALEAADPNQKLSSDSKASNSTSASTTVGASCDPQETNGGTGANTTLQILVAGYEVMGRKENQRIRQAVLGDLAYVALCLEDPLKALVAARSLQQLPDCSKMYLFLSYVYAAESLCRLNQPIEAAEQLSVFVTDGRNVELPYTNEDTQKWSDENGADCGELNGSATAKTAVEGTKKTMEESQDMGFLKPEKARGVLYVNLAAISAMQGVLEQASHFVKQGLSSLPNNPRVLLAAAYVDLLQGKAQEALVKLRKCRRIRYLSTNVTISS